jgi:hypothetical protein
MRLTSKIQVNSKLKELADRGPKAAQALAVRVANRGLKYAQENVSEGVGPGPHPHRLVSPYTGAEINWDHEDTNDLKRSLKVTKIQRGAIGEAGVFTDSPVGMWLELGFIQHQSGRYYRYPWLYPAFEQAQADFADAARAILSEYLSGEGTMSEDRATVRPEVQSSQPVPLSNK